MLRMTFASSGASFARTTHMGSPPVRPSRMVGEEHFIISNNGSANMFFNSALVQLRSIYTDETAL
jgi:hypothetical protein